MTVVKTKGGVMDLDIDLDEVRAEGERERVRILIEETASAARQEAIAQALSELEHEIEKVVRVELAEVIKESKASAQNAIAVPGRSRGISQHGVPRIRCALPHSLGTAGGCRSVPGCIWPPRAAT